MLLKTKLYAPPMREGGIIRQRLLDELDVPAHGVLTLLQAPAGYGKTTLLRQWLECKDYVYAWLSLDEQENDPNRFWSYVVGAIQSVYPEVGMHAFNQLSAGLDLDLKSVILTLINDLTELQKPYNGIALLLVLDDYHVINNQLINETVSWFLDNLPAIIHVAMTSRTQPDIAIPRRRVRNELVEVGCQQLNFIPVEIRQFFEQTMKAPISLESSYELEKKTAGWVAGVQLAALSMKGADKGYANVNLPDFSGSHQYVVRYLEQEILAMMSREVHDFLLKLSVLPRFSASLCDSVVVKGTKDSTPASKLLGMLERQNLFLIPLDERDEWFRLHHFFSDALEKIARAEYPQVIEEIQRSAANWFERNDCPNDALHHFFSIREWGRATQLIERLGFDRMLAGQNESLEWWMQQLPDSCIEVSPKLCLIRAWGLFATPEVLDAGYYLDIAEQQLPVTHDEYESLKRHIAIFRVQLARIQGDHDAADSHSQQYSLKGEGDLGTEDVSLPSAAQLALGLDAFSTGDLLRAVSLLKIALNRAKREENCFSVLAVSMVLSQTYFQQGYSQRGLDQCEIDRKWLLEHKQAPHFVDCWLNMVRVEILRELELVEEAKEGLQVLQAYVENGALPQHVSSVALIELAFLSQAGLYDKIEPALMKMQSILEADNSQYAHFSPDVGALRAKYAFRSGDIRVVQDWFDTPQRSNDNNTAYNLQQEDILRARVMNLRGKKHEALVLLEETRAAAELGYCRINVVRCLITEVLMHHHNTDISAAQAVLREALVLANDSFRRLFLDEGQVIESLFEDLTSQGIEGWWSARVGSARLSSSQELGQVSGWNEQLTSREHQIMELIAKGMSNQQIADQLYIALATTKTHIRNIFEKLGVSRRTQAIARARELKVIA